MFKAFNGTEEDLKHGVLLFVSCFSSSYLLAEVVRSGGCVYNVVEHADIGQTVLGGPLQSTPRPLVVVLRSCICQESIFAIYLAKNQPNDTSQNQMKEVLLY